MRLGVSFTATYAGGMSRQRLVNDARAAEQAGFDSMWFFDALGRGHMLPDPLQAIAIAAGGVERLEFGTCILQVPLRYPAELAQRVLTTQMACDGRFTLGVGAGSTRGDFELVGVDFDARMRALNDGLAIMQALWRGETVNGFALSPWPDTIGGPPIMVGSWAGSKWIPRAATEFDGWIGSGAKSTTGKLRAGVNRFREAGGKRAMVTNIHVDLNASGAPLSEDAPFSLRCSSEEARRRLALLAELGFDDAVFMLPDNSPQTLDAIRALMP